MSIEVKLPEIGDGITSGDVLEVFVSEGETVAKDQMIVELETDKATVPIYSSHGGQISKIHVSPGDTVNIGETLISVEGSANTTPAEPTPATPAEPTPATPAEPTSATPAEPTSATPAEPTPAPLAEPTPAPPAISSPSSAPPQQPPADAVEPAPQASSQPTVEPQPLAANTASPVEQAATISAPPPAPLPAESSQEDSFVPAGPSVRRFAREVGVDLQQVDGTGLGGRITREDVIQFVRQSADAQKPTDSPVSENATIAKADDSASLPSKSAVVETLPGERSSDEFGPVRTEKMSRIRRTIANNMHQSWSTIPRVTNFDDADVTELEEFRQASKADYASRGIKLTAMPFVIKAIAAALRAHPIINASLSDDGQIIYKDYVNIGIAVDSERGLVVPVIRNADRLSIPELSAELGELATKVRGGNIDLESLRGGTFTISNLGAIGGSYSTPIINSPEVAILLAGRSRKMPVIINDHVVARLMMPLSLSYDHRLVDGGAAARFLNEVIDYLSAPGRLLLAP